MDETSSFRQKWLFIVGWTAFLIIGYLVIVYFIKGFWDNPLNILRDFIVFIVLQIVWMAFFAQFVLPVRTFRDRQKIFDRLISYLSGGHGPAIFIENGKKREKPGESEKKGPGVLWLDSASAAVTRTATAIKQTMGPGVHFIERGEFIAGTIDLHNQAQSLGPKESDKPFSEKKEGQEDAEYREIQNRRKEVSGLTRDGIEVVPNISVTFRVATESPKNKQPGSRFGYRLGITKKDKKKEDQDKEAISKAILGEGINPKERVDSPRHRIAWNHLPAVLAVDVWREYVAKFTLDELFKPEQLVPPAPSQLSQPLEEEIDLLSQPLKVSTNQRTREDVLTSFFRSINLGMDWMIKWLERKEDGNPQKPTTSQLSASASTSAKNEPQKKTALQVINEMVKARLTQAEVEILDDTGKRGEGTISSQEFKLLKERGLKVISVNINTPRFDPAAEESIIKAWNASWLKNAKTESEHIDRRRNIIEKTAEEDAKRQYIKSLSREINEQKKKGTPDPKQMLKTLIIWSHSIIQSSEQLRRRMPTEIQDIEEMIKWIEANGK